jgi:hypothetical protein
MYSLTFSIIYSQFFYTNFASLLQEETREFRKKRTQKRGNSYIHLVCKGNGGEGGRIQIRIRIDTIRNLGKFFAGTENNFPQLRDIMLSLLETSTPRTRQRKNPRYTFTHASFPSVAVAFFLFLHLQLFRLFRQPIVTLLHSSDSDVIAYFPRLIKKLLFILEIFSTFVYRTVFGWVFISSGHWKFNRNLRYFEYRYRY